MTATHQDFSSLTPNLWKFLSLAPNQTPDWTVKLSQIVLDGKAWFSSPDDFNDLFDCSPIVQVPVTKEDILSKKDVLISQMVKSLQNEYSEDHIVRETSSALENCDPETLLRNVNASIRRSASGMGVFCLSESLDSVLMWSHYTNNHCGLAVRFRPMDRRSENALPLFKVQYQKARPVIDALFSAFPTMDITDALITKADFWAYEREWRSLKPHSARELVSFDQGVIDAIVFGAKCPKSDRLLVQRLLDQKSIKYFEAVGDYDTFRLRFFEC